MSFTFIVDDVGRLPVAGICYIEGRLESGIIKGGEVASVDGLQGQTIAIKSVALVNTAQQSYDKLTLSVVRPQFPLEDLLQHRLIATSSADCLSTEGM